MAEKKRSRFREAAGSAKEEMQKRTQESQRHSAGTNKWKNYLIPEFDGDLFVATEGDHVISIIPYLTGEKDPKLDPGKRAYMVDVYVHKKVGVNEDDVLCPASNYRGKKCPICEHQIKMKQSGMFDDKMIKELNPKRRILYNVVVLTTVESENKGVQVWEASYHLTENEILAIARDRRSGGFTPFADPDDGKDIEFYREGQGSATRYKGYKFIDREEPISDEDLEDAYCLDELLDLKTEQEIFDLFSPTAPEIPGQERQHSAPEGESEDKPEYDKTRRPRNRSSRNKPEEAQQEGSPENPDSGEESTAEEPTSQEESLASEQPETEEKPKSRIGRRVRR